jgi:hypothetical protein
VSVPEGSSPLRWSGGANVPTRGGWRVNASTPLAELAVTGGLVVLRLRSPLATLCRAETLSARAADLRTVFPIRSKGRFRGVGFRRLDGREYYFKTTQIDTILRVPRCCRVSGVGDLRAGDEDLARYLVSLARRSAVQVRRSSIRCEAPFAT